MPLASALRTPQSSRSVCPTVRSPSLQLTHPGTDSLQDAIMLASAPLESKWILSPMPKLVRYIHKGPRGLCLSNSGYLHFYFNLDGDELQQMAWPRCTLKPSAPYTVPNVLQSHRAICPQVWFCTGSLGFQFGQSSPQASSTVGRHKARDPRNTAIILRVQAYGKRMPNTVSQSKITAENSFGKNIHGHSRA